MNYNINNRSTIYSDIDEDYKCYNDNYKIFE